MSASAGGGPTEAAGGGRSGAARRGSTEAAGSCGGGPTTAGRRRSGRQFRRPLWRRVLSGTWLLLGAVLAVAHGAAFAVPQLWGGQGLTVLSGSMEPAFGPGDVVAVRPLTPDAVCDTVALGDLITFLPYPDDPTLITHRVTAITVGDVDGWECRLTTQGDANSAADAPVLPLQVRATVVYAVPHVGWVRQWATDHRALVLAVAGIGAALWIGTDPVMTALARRHARDRGLAAGDAEGRTAGDAGTRREAGDGPRRAGAGDGRTDRGARRTGGQRAVVALRAGLIVLGAVALVVAGGTTAALWRTEAPTAGGTILAGDLWLGADSANPATGRPDPAYVLGGTVSGDGVVVGGEPLTVPLDPHLRLDPGDVVTAVYDVEVGLHGDNLTADLTAALTWPADAWEGWRLHAFADCPDSPADLGCRLSPEGGWTASGPTALPADGLLTRLTGADTRTTSVRLLLTAPVPAPGASGVEGPAQARFAELALSLRQTRAPA